MSNFDLQGREALLPPAAQSIHGGEGDGNARGLMCQGHTTGVEEHLWQGDDAFIALYKPSLCVNFNRIPACVPKRYSGRSQP